MNKKIAPLLAAIAILTVTLACSLFSNEMSLTNLRMAFDSDGANPTSVYSTTDVFFAVGDLANAPAGTVVEARWLAVQIEGYAAGESIYEQTINDFTEDNFGGTIYFQLSNDSGWTPGEYKVDIYLNGNFVQSIPFSVQ
ncbi:MAG: hypothetical protein ACOYYU_08105 [Chloroflexota bacterium]